MCEKDFKNGSEFKDHWRTHSSDTKISNSLKDSCKIQCKVCGKCFNFSSFRLHISREHEISQRNYKKRYHIKSFLLSEKFLHKCAVCNEFLLLDSERLRNHMQVKHKGDNITWQEYQLRHMNQEKEKSQKDHQSIEKQRTKSVEELCKSVALNHQINEGIAADADNQIQVPYDDRNEVDNGDKNSTYESRTESHGSTFDEQKCGNKTLPLEMLPLKLESPEPLQDMEDPLNIDAEDKLENIVRQGEGSLGGSGTDVSEVEFFTVPGPGGVDCRPRSGGVGCPQCARKFTLTGQLVNMRDNLRCHIGLVHFSHQLSKELRKVFEGTHCQMCDFASEKKDKRKRHLIYKHTMYVAEILEITDTTIKSFIEANTRKTEMDKKEEDLKKTNKDAEENIAAEIETKETLKLSPRVKKNQATAKDETFCLLSNNNDFDNAEKAGESKRGEPMGDVASLVVKDPHLIERFRRFINRIQSREKAIHEPENAELDKEQRFSAIELILQLDTVKIRELAK